MLRSRRLHLFQPLYQHVPQYASSTLLLLVWPWSRALGGWLKQATCPSRARQGRSASVFLHFLRPPNTRTNTRTGTAMEDYDDDLEAMLAAEEAMEQEQMAMDAVRALF